MGRSRNRKVIVCVSCKRRKIRCDRTVPCSSCVARGVDCSYEPSVTHENTTTTVKYWRRSGGEVFKGLNPCPGITKFNVHHQYHPFFKMKASSNRYYGPFSWISLILTDDAMIPLLRRGKKFENKNDSVAQGGTKKMFEERIQNEPLVNEQLNLSARRTYRENSVKTVHSNELAKNLGLTVASAPDGKYPHLIREAVNLLPTRDILWFLIDCFFSRVYPFFPIIDQQTFQAWVLAAVGAPEPNSKIESLQITKQMDIAHLGMLLLVLRFGYLSMFSSFCPSISNQEQMSTIRNNPIPIDTFDIARKCFQYFESLKNCNFTVIQLALFIKLYYMYAPELGLSPEDTNLQSFSSLLVRMSLSIGLHRDPDDHNFLNCTRKEGHLRRKVWYTILYADFQCSANSGFPITVRVEEFDTKLPFYEEGAENCFDIEQEKRIPLFFEFIWKQYRFFCTMSLQVANIRVGMTDKDLCNSLTDWENQTLNLHSIPFGRVTPLEVKDCYQLISYFESMTLFGTMTFRLYLYFSKFDVDLGYYYLKKIMSMLIIDMVKVSVAIEKQTQLWFSDISDLCLIPALESYLHRGIIILQSLMFKTRFSIIAYDPKRHIEEPTSSSIKQHRFQQTYDLTEKLYFIILRCFSMFGSRYYYSWRCSTAQRDIQKVRKGPDYYVKNYSQSRELGLDDDMLDDFIALLESALSSSENHDPLTSQEPLPHMPVPIEWDLTSGPLKELEDLWSVIFPQPPLFGSFDDIVL